MEIREVLKIQAACKLVPVGYAVLVKPYEKQTPDSKIILSKSAKAEMDISDNRATIVAIGPLAWSGEYQPRAALGDNVLMTKFAGAMVTGEDGENYRVVNDQDIYCRLAGGAQ